MTSTDHTLASAVHSLRADPTLEARFAQLADQQGASLDEAEVIGGRRLSAFVARHALHCFRRGEWGALHVGSAKHQEALFPLDERRRVVAMMQERTALFFISPQRHISWFASKTDELGAGAYFAYWTAAERNLDLFDGSAAANDHMLETALSAVMQFPPKREDVNPAFHGDLYS